MEGGDQSCAELGLLEVRISKAWPYLFDPHEEIDAWCMANQEILELHGIYLEHPEKTPGWSHWTVRKPASGQRVFFP